MKKFLVASVCGLMLMFAASTKSADAAVYRGGYRGHVHTRPVYRPTVYHHYAARPYVYANDYRYGSGYGYGSNYGSNYGCW